MEPSVPHDVAVSIEGGGALAERVARDLQARLPGRPLVVLLPDGSEGDSGGETALARRRFRIVIGHPSVGETSVPDLVIEATHPAEHAVDLILRALEQEGLMPRRDSPVYSPQEEAEVVRRLSDLGYI